MRRVLVGFSVGVALFVVVLAFMDVREVVSVLSAVNGWVFALTVASALGGIGLLGESFRRLRRSMGPEEYAGFGRFHATYLRAYFIRLMVPVGSSGAPAIVGYVFHREFDGRFEEELAVATAAELLNFIGSSSLALVGLAVFLFNGGRIPHAGAVSTVAVVVFVGAFAALAVLLFRPTTVDRPVYALAGGVDATLGTVFDRVHETVARESVAAKLDQFHETMALLRSAPKTMALSLALAIAAWVGLSLPLFLGLADFGATVPLALAFFVVPISGFTYVLPVSGGLGGVEAVLVTLVAAGTDVGVPVAAAAVILHRVATFWVPVALGAVATTVEPGDFHAVQS